MEFPNTGDHCSIQDCKQLDFLPCVCNHCKHTFCKEHVYMESHKCEKFVDNVVSVKEKLASYLCSNESCKETSPVEMPCIKCKKHFCLTHRYHDCFEESKEETATKLKKWQIPKKQFADAKAIVDQQVSEKLKKSKNSAMANKVQLMRVKGSAIGPKSVPTDERSYFLVHAPITIPANKNVASPRATFVNSRWTIGKVVDSIADTLKLPNFNNTSNTKKLLLFHHSTGACVSTQMDITLKELFETSSLTDGQTLVLEYSDGTSVDSSLYK